MKIFYLLRSCLPVLLILNSSILLAIEIFDCGKKLEIYEKSYLQKKDDNGLREIDKLEYEPPADQYLSLAERVAIARYTVTSTITEPWIMHCGSLKLPAKTVRVFRGQSTNAWKIKNVGQVVTLIRLVSTSTSSSVAKAFISNPETGQLLVINAKTARDITPYSQVLNEGMNEKEHFLLQGSRLKVIKMENKRITFYHEDGTTFRKLVPVIELNEV